MYVLDQKDRYLFSVQDWAITLSSEADWRGCNWWATSREPGNDEDSGITADLDAYRINDDWTLVRGWLGNISHKKSTSQNSYPISSLSSKNADKNTI
jgi:hypothetical protein